LVETRIIQVSATIINRPIILYGNTSNQKHPDIHTAHEVASNGQGPVPNPPKRAQMLVFYIFTNPIKREDNIPRRVQAAINKQTRSMATVLEHHAWELENSLAFFNPARRTIGQSTGLAEPL
jgi:hypothetical protein